MTRLERMKHEAVGTWLQSVFVVSTAEPHELREACAVLRFAEAQIEFLDKPNETPADLRHYTAAAAARHIDPDLCPVCGGYTRSVPDDSRRRCHCDLMVTLESDEPEPANDWDERLKAEWREDQFDAMGDDS